MSQVVEFRLTADERQAVSAWLAVDRQIKQHNTSLAAISRIEDGNARSAQASANAHHKAMQESLARIGQFATAAVGVGSVLGGIQTAVGVLKSEWQNLVDAQRQAAGTQVSLQAARRAMIANLNPDGTLSDTEALEEIDKIASDLRVNPRDVTLAFSDVLSAKSDAVSNRQALETVRTALAVAPEGGTNAQLVAGGVSDLQGAFGVDPQQAAGFLQNLQSANRATSTAALAKNALPKLIALTKFGDTPEQAGEIISAFGKSSADAEASVSATAALQVAGRLQEVLGKLRPDLMSTLDRIDAVRADPKLQTAVFAKEFGETAFKPLIRELLTGADDAATVRALRGAQSTVVSPEAAAGIFLEKLERVAKLPTAGVEVFGRGVKGLTAQAEAANLQGGFAGQIREDLPKFLQSLGYSGTQQFVEMRRFNKETQLQGVDPAAYLERRFGQEIEQRLATTKIEQVRTGSLLGDGGYTERTVPRVPSETDRQIAAALTELVSLARESRQQMSEQTQVIQQTTGGMRPNTSPPKPVAAVGRQSRDSN